MTQYALIVSCWVLTVGWGTGLAGLSSDEHKTTTLQPHSPGPPPPTLPSLTTTDTIQHTTRGYPLANTSLTFYPLHVNLSTPPIGDIRHVDVLSRAWSTTPSSTSTNPSRMPTSTTYIYSLLKEIEPKTTVSAQIDRPETKGSYTTNSITTNTLSPNKSKSEEHIQEIPQTSHREQFIRRKHKEPYHADRVRKLSAVLRVTDTPDFPTYTETSSKPALQEKNNTYSHLRQSIPQESVFKNKIVQATTRPELHSNPHQKIGGNKLGKDHHPRIKPIMMGIPASSTVLQSQRATSTLTPTLKPNKYNPADSEEYYSSYVEYPDVPIFGYNKSGYSEAAVLPDPDIAPRPENMEVEAEVEAEVVLPDDSLADTDLHDHDLIDSVMYIYFGSSERDERGAGRQVLIVGAVISLVAQSLTLISVLRRLRSRPEEYASLILLNAELALTSGNLVFMLGVQATGSQRRCEVVAFTLHYLHLAACAWFLVNSVFSYASLQCQGPRRLRPWWFAAWGCPAIIVILCVVFNRRGYETRSFCWVSVARGMLYSFMAPVAILILLNTCFAVLGLRQLSLSAKMEESDQKSMRISAILLPVYAVVWFLGVVALENSASLVFPLLFVASSGFLNWFILACWLPADMSLWRESDDDFDEDDDDLYEEVLKTHTDSHPLLEESHIYVCGRRDTCDLQMDPICTISS